MYTSQMVRGGQDKPQGAVLTDDDLSKMEYFMREGTSNANASAQFAARMEESKQ